MIKTIIYIFALWFICLPSALAKSSFHMRLGKFDNDASICQHLITHDRSSVCAIVRDLSGKINKFREIKHASSEEDPLADAYYEANRLSVLELASTTMLSDTITHYYLLDNSYIFITTIQTPHPEKLKEQIPGSSNTHHQMPIITAYLLTQDGNLLDTATVQNMKHLSFIKSQFDDVMYDYHDFETKTTQ